MITDGSMRIRRQVYELTILDIEASPAWEFAVDEEGSDGQDEATVRPYVKVPIDPADGLQVVRATFTLADGSVATGFMSPMPPGLSSDISNHQPTIITERGHIGFYFGIFAPTAEQISRSLNMLGKSHEKIFPLHYRTDVEIVGGYIERTVPGFCYMKRVENGSVRPDPSLIQTVSF